MYVMHVTHQLDQVQFLWFIPLLATTDMHLASEGSCACVPLNSLQKLMQLICIVLSQLAQL